MKMQNKQSDDPGDSSSWGGVREIGLPNFSEEEWVTNQSVLSGKGTQIKRLAERQSFE